MRKFKRPQRHSLPFGLFLAVAGALLLPAALAPRANAGSTGYWDFEDPLSSRPGPAPELFSQPQGVLINQSLASNYTPTLALNVAPGDQPGAFQPVQLELPLAPDLVRTWTGGAGTGAWGTNTNWSPTGVPANGDTEVFDAAAANSQFSITLGANRTTAGITFSSTGATGFTFGNGGLAANFVFNGDMTNNNANTQTFNSELDVRIQNPITFNAASGGFTFNSTVSLRDTLTLAGPGAQTFNGTLTNFGANETITNNSTGSVTFSDINLSDNNTGRTLTFNGSGDATVSGIIRNGGTGAGNLTYSGSGTLTLAASNTYTGATSVTAGTLLVNGSTTVASAVTVTNGGTTLGGTGTIGGTVSVGAGANIAPGNGGNNTAVLTTGALTMASTSNFRVDINGTTLGTGYDQVHVATGGVTFTGSNTNLVVTVGTILSVGQMFTILDKTAAGAISGTFAGIPQGGTVVGSDGTVFTVSYTGGDGNDIVLTVTAAPVPEPSTWMGGALAIAGLAFTQRRRLRKSIAFSR